ncbi:winged helix-turn-helix domain-containing protein [Geodermatophilus ruber]|uniref:DNA-binding response regulator, OmpR family, contains REC and winged-helix (WHTH) domain n=1 Tax=Geodermatophilus ruber TaxID=504800 RepID=A0A1I4EZI2_9ACTN|nr:response regulator transcription factor [Geodermatophilus ruber]SFL09541.1 DNA-binding response regulator, OmpR family, contains REC and winged-helix (wHTH) domain [Geodermatophilus ruber]
MSRLLLVEDDAALAEALQLALSGLGHDLVLAGSGEAAVDLALGDEPVDLVLLDVMLPGIDGFEACRRISTASTTPIILLTARGDAVDTIVGLECGADDYIVKPAEPRLIDARVKAVLRRSSRRPAEPARRHVLGRVELDETAMVVTRDGRELSLTPTELRLLVEFARHPGQVLSRQVLLDRVWEYGYLGDSRLVDACVQRLRAKVEPDPANPTLIRTVRGIGYRLAPA